MIRRPLRSTLFPYPTRFRSKTDPASQAHRPCAEFDLTLRHSFTPKLVKPTSLTRAVTLAAEGPPQVEAKARFVRGQRHGACQRSEEHTPELQSHLNLVCRLL